MSLLTALHSTLRTPAWSLRVILPGRWRRGEPPRFRENPMKIATIARAAVRGLVVLASVGALVATGVAWSVQQHVSTTIVTSNALTPHPVLIGQAFTALLVGLDARTDANGNPLPPALLDAIHAGPDEGQLHTDTIILLHVPALPGEPAVAISIPRDSYVQLADGSGKHKINSAYNRGLVAAEKDMKAQGISGPELDRRGREAGRAALIATVESLMGTSIDHYGEINLAGFVELTDALGGVPVCLNKPVRDTYSGLDLPAGYQTVNGQVALAFVRQRHGLDGGDLDRIARQQAFIAGLTQRVQGEGTLTDPATLSQLLGVVTRHVVIDKGWDLQQAATQASRIAGADLSFHTIPTGRPDLETPVDGVAVQVDPAAVRAFVTEQFSAKTPTSSPTASTAPTGTATATPAPSATPTKVITAGGVPCVN
jgi:LCP family protein required for cell wall assembly